MFFDGTSAVALTEEAITQPINVYGVKRAGELACLEVNPDAVIIRTSWVYSRFGNNFVKPCDVYCRSAILVLSRIKSDLHVCSRFGSGDDGHSYSTGMDPRIYNYSNEGEISWYEFVLAIQEIGGYSCRSEWYSFVLLSTPANGPAFLCG
jgi:dTDP-4-dehydrorhamnose reductase